MPSADTARLFDGTVWNAERLKLGYSAFPSDARDNLGDASDGIENASDAMKNSSDASDNASDATYKAHTFVHQEDVGKPPPTVAEPVTPSIQETEEQPVDEPPLGEQRPSDAGFDAV